MTDVIIGAILGLLAGLAFQRVTIFQIKRRSSETSKIEAIDNAAVIITWMVLSAVLFAVIFYNEQNAFTRTAYILYISIAISIGVVDIDIKKIPNMSLLILLVVRTAHIIYTMCTGGSFKTSLLPALIGLGIGLVLYLIPSLFRIPIGAGDVKYCGVIGYCLGIFGFLQAALIMAVGLLIYLVYLLITKKGSLKTSTAMGPYLSLGVIITILFPLYTNISLPF